MPTTSTRGRGRALTRHGNASDVTINVKVDPARKKELERLLAIMQSAVREEALGFDAYWEAVGTILSRELFADAGYDSPEAFLKATVKEKPRTALRMIRVARHASPAEEAKYGTSILDAALSYIEAKTGGAVNGSLPIRFEALRIPVTRDGSAKRLPLEKATLADITAATRALTTAAGSSRARSSPAEQHIAARLHGIASLAKVTVHVSGGVLRVGGIPLAALQHFVAALRGLDLTASAPKARRGNAKKRSSAKTAKKRAPAR